MKIKHKNSQEIIEDFPHYYKSGFYGFLSLTNENEVLFFYNENEEITYTYLTDEFEIIKNEQNNN